MILAIPIEPVLKTQAHNQIAHVQNLKRFCKMNQACFSASSQLFSRPVALPTHEKEPLNPWKKIPAAIPIRIPLAASRMRDESGHAPYSLTTVVPSPPSPLFPDRKDLTSG